MQLWLVRHGESTWNPARHVQGARDTGLSPRGHEQAQVPAGLTAIWRLRIDNTSVTRVELPGGRLASLNDTGHLDGRREAEPPRPADAGRP